MSRQNVRAEEKYLHGFIKNFAQSNVDDRPETLRMFTKVVIEKKTLRDRFSKLMDDAERAIGRE
tara:strand:- start:279 stop:470 length:192 start_codon:yes stop_codon:yes gene_type:complete